MNYSQLINNNYEYNNYNSHRYLDELEWIKVAIFSQAINVLKYTMIKKNRIVLIFIALIIKISKKQNKRLWNGMKKIEK